MRSRRSECYFQAEEAQGGSTTPALVRPHSGDLPPEHVQVRAEARGGRGGVRERRASCAGRRLLRIVSCAVARPLIGCFLVCILTL